MIDYCKKVEDVKERINIALSKSPYNQKVKLIAVSKTFPSDIIKKVYNCGIIDFGENYVQELLKKQEELKDCEIKWHFIGHLQKNKAKYIFDKIEMLHSLDSLELAKILNKRLENKDLKLKCLIQINIGNEPNKYGININEVENFLKAIENFKNIEIKGFMCIPPFSIYKEDSRKYYRKMREIFEMFKNENITELSMGMSNDFEVAIEEGATMIRIGTLIFGQRV